MRVLVVEDDQKLASSIVRGLGEAGFAVDSVHDGESAIAAALATPYDVIVLDVMLPKADGREVSRQLRSRRMQAPILMLTARDGVEDRVRGLESGADDYLGKPFAMKEVIARINALSRRHLANRSATLQVGELELDTAAHRLSVRGREVRLTAKEYTVLEYLMLNPGRLLCNDQILEHAWSFALEGGDNLVEVYIGRLRRKLADATAGDRIVTVRGGGYRIEASES